VAVFCKQGNEHSGLLRYNAVSIGKLLPMFRRHFLISSSGFKSEFRYGESELLCEVGNYLIIGMALYLRSYKPTWAHPDLCTLQLSPMYHRKEGIEDSCQNRYLCMV
jgi:hypothetical protein